MNGINGSILAKRTGCRISDTSAEVGSLLGSSPPGGGFKGQERLSAKLANSPLALDRSSRHSPGAYLGK